MVIARLRTFIVLGVVVGLLGCGFEGLSSGQAPAPPPGPRQVSDAPPFLMQTNEVFTKAEQALKIDGRPEARKVALEVSNCTGSLDACSSLASSLETTSRIGSRAGLAGNFAKRVSWGHQPGENKHFVQEAERLADEALDFAKKDHETKEAEAQAHGEQAAEEQRQVNETKVACKADVVGCKKRCDAGETTWCVALGERYYAENKVYEARAILAKACTAKDARACDLSQKLDAIINDGWGSVLEVGDDLAQKLFQTDQVAKLRPHVASRMRTINASILSEKFCPTKKAFIGKYGAALFAQKTADHCKSDPPSAQGLSGADVTLTSQCTQVYNSACP